MRLTHAVLGLLVGMAGLVADTWTVQPSGVSVRLRGVSAVNERVAWASGADGTVLRTEDGGGHWTAVGPAEARGLDIRDVDAVGERAAYALSIGPGEASRIFRTIDAGRTWTTQFVNADPKAFFNGMAFWDADRGLAMGDAVDGVLVILSTRDGGRTWSRVPASALPPALPGEGGFAASGTSVAVAGLAHAWVATGAGPRARVFRTTDSGQTWAVADTPLRSGPSAGIFSIAFADSRHGVVVGGDHQAHADAIENAAVSGDGGATWTLVSARGLRGYRSAVAFVDDRRVLAVGPSGADLSRDGGRSWERLDAPGLHAIATVRGTGIGWGVGEQGLIARLRVDRRVGAPQ